MAADVAPTRKVPPPNGPGDDAVQYREWDTAVHTIELINRLDSVHRDRDLDRGLDHGIGLEL